MDRTTRLTPEDGLRRLGDYPFQVLTWIDASGYPMSVAVSASLDPASGTASLDLPGGLRIPDGAEVSLTGSHIRPQPGYGYDERRHVSVWGPATLRGGSIVVSASFAWGWDESEVPFFEYSERSIGQSRRYFDALAAERGTPVRPQLSRGWLALRATRLPFLTATLVPILLGLAIAARHGFFDPVTAVLTLVGGALIQIGLNVANDVFDTAQGADDFNVTPTRFSGGSRVIQYGLLTYRQMQGLAAAAYAGGIAVGIVLLVLTGSLVLLLIGVVGVVVSLGYTAPPLKLVYRGLGEVAVALGFGPLMLVGTYVVQSRGTVDLEPLVASVPIGLLVAMILYVNEIPDRRSDARASKRTLPVRFGRESVVRGFAVAIGAAYATTVAGVLLGVLPATALAVLLTIPLAREVHDGLRPNYDNPYTLMAVMAKNIQLHALAGALLFLAYVVVLVGGALAPSVPFFVR